MIRLTEVSLLLGVPRDSPHRSVADLIAAARARPEALNFGTPGPGTTGHLATQMLLSLTGTRITHGPFRGRAPAAQELVAGPIDLLIDGTLLPTVQQGSIRALAVTGATQSPFTPALPTVGEAGVPGYDFASWHGVVAPRGTPAETIARLNAAFNAALRDATGQARARQLGLPLTGGHGCRLRCLDRGRAREVRATGPGLWRARRMSVRPNILFVTFDQWPASMTGYESHPAVLTPTLDQLARNSVRYSRTYTECPICIPARRTMMTGTTARRHGDRSFDPALRIPDLSTLPSLLREAGYQTVAVGKLNVYPPRDRIGFEEVLLAKEGRPHLAGPDDHDCPSSNALRRRVRLGNGGSGPSERFGGIIRRLGITAAD